MLVMLLFAASSLPASASPELNEDMLDLINSERSSQGLAALVPYWDLEDDAAKQTARQVRQGKIFHTADLGAVVDGGWSSIGENVGVGPSISSLHKAFMNSPGHRANILGNYSHIGISTKTDQYGQKYITLIFMKATSGIAHAEPLTTLPKLSSLPSDAVGNTFASDITWLASNGIALGCDTNAYCPNRPITRGEMATVLAWGLELSPTSTDYFSDDDGSPHEANINAVAAAGITLGCNPPDNNYFCEQETLTRAQMASFFTRALGLPPAASDQFGDDNDSIHQADINALGTSGITRGCNPPTNDRYCPDQPLTRGQIAAFLRRALN